MLTAFCKVHNLCHGYDVKYGFFVIMKPLWKSYRIVRRFCCEDW